MKTMTCSSLRTNLAETIKNICSTHDELIITRSDNKNVVMMPLEDFNGWKATMYLLSTPANAESLRKSINELNRGKGVKKDLIEC